MIHEWQIHGLEQIKIKRYFGSQLPGWMRDTSTTLLMSLKILMLHDLACCTQLHDGLCHLPCLEFLEVYRAVAIKRVGPEFVQPYSHHHHPSSWVVVAFSRLNRLILNEMVEWEEWEWEKVRNWGVSRLALFWRSYIYACFGVYLQFMITVTYDHCMIICVDRSIWS